jgi:glycosyltransferase involved in cell wall biosynthesis
MTVTSLVYEPNVGAHQAEYLLWVTKAWARAHPVGRRLVVCAPAELADRRPEIRTVADRAGIALDLADGHDPAGRLVTGGIDRWGPLAGAVDRHDARRVFVQILDHYLPPLAARRALPGVERFGGLLFRPTLHYPEIGSPPRSVSDRVQWWAKAAVTRQALRHPALTDVLSLDPSAVSALTRTSRATVRAILDPVPPEAPSRPPAQVRAEYGLEPGRKLVAFAGVLDDRKGAVQGLRALAALRPEAAARTAAVLAGRVVVADRAGFDRAVGAARDRGVQVVIRDAFLSPEDLAALVAAADLLALPYDRHVGSSGFLVRAAAAGTPVLSQAYGWMGHAVRTHRLGWTADPADPAAFARAMEHALAGSPSPGDRAAAAFVRPHTVEAFAAPILDILASSCA